MGARDWTGTSLARPPGSLPGALCCGSSMGGIRFETEWEMLPTNDRRAIAKEVSRQALVECGFKCPVPRCDTQWPTLQHHHIDGDPSNGSLENILMLCPTHHQMVTSGHIDRKTCKMLKELLSKFSDMQPSPVVRKRHELLYSLTAELCANLLLFQDPAFHRPHGHQVCPRFLHNVLDVILASGAFIYEQDQHLFSLLYDWCVSLDDVNRRLDVTEFRDLPRLQLEQGADLRRGIPVSPGFQGPRELCCRLTAYLLEGYGEEAGADHNTVFFGKRVSEILALARLPDLAAVLRTHLSGDGVCQQGPLGSTISSGESTRSVTDSEARNSLTKDDAL